MTKALVRVAAALPIFLIWWSLALAQDHRQEAMRAVEQMWTSERLLHVAFYASDFDQFDRETVVLARLHESTAVLSSGEFAICRDAVYSMGLMATILDPPMTAERILTWESFYKAWVKKIATCEANLGLGRPRVFDPSSR